MPSHLSDQLIITQCNFVENMGEDYDYHNRIGGASTAPPLPRIRVGVTNPTRVQQKWALSGARELDEIQQNRKTALLSKNFQKNWDEG
uniref:Uncharacterized protein n=1 Tax=Romanomermis culicivorax TaxID=13658 RepID=A0A915JZ13_ROMCU